MQSAARVAWTIGRGPIPKGIHVLHHCDNPRCVNYEKHLFLGTHADNMADMNAKNRNGARLHPERIQRGDAHYSRRRPELVARGDRHYRRRRQSP